MHRSRWSVTIWDPPKQGLKLSSCCNANTKFIRHNMRSTKTRIETNVAKKKWESLKLSQYEIHQNKDWNSLVLDIASPSNFVTIWDPPKQGLKPQSRWRRNKLLPCHNMRSTKTRIETYRAWCSWTFRIFVTIWDPPKQGLKRQEVFSLLRVVLSQYEIHQNKDWNSHITLPLFALSVSQYEIHQNKDWNLGNVLSKIEIC